MDLPWSLALTCGRLLVHALVALAMLVVLCGPVLTFMHYFEQENLLLPRVSQHTMTLSYRMNTHWYVIIPAFLLLDGFILLGLLLLKRPWRFLARAWFGTVLIAAILLLAYCFIGIAVPMDDTLLASDSPDVGSAP